MNQPSPLLQGLERRAEHTLVDKQAETVEVLEGGVPVLHQYFGGELAPHTVEVVHVGGLDEDTMEVQIFTCSRVISALILNLNTI